MGFLHHLPTTILMCIAMVLLGNPIYAQEEKAHSDEQIIQAFTSQETKDSELITINDQRKRLVMFVLGVPLLILVLVTGALGVAMGIYGKPVFVAHMICAGLSMTLALGHAIVGLVWFFPF